MTKERINRIEINWRDMFKTITGLQTGPKDAPVINEVVIVQEIIPIIFVPGIMGSRLKYKPEDPSKKDEKPKRAWDPDGIIFMSLKYAFSSPKKRKKKLIGKQSHNSEYLAVDNKNKAHNKKFPGEMEKNGWGGVFWSSYGKFLKVLTDHDWPEPLNACFHFPVYAFGYNWTASNTESGEQLAAFIKQTIDDNAKNSECNQVILVTHSMGGLVARAACMLHGAKDQVLGVVHGVQPATGAPAAYFRMKTGFEPPNLPNKLSDWFWNFFKPPWKKFEGTIANYVLGNYGPDVTIIIANSPGALELLPNKLYKDSNGSSQWLSYTDHLGKRSDFPQKDPYTDIYSKREPAYRLVTPEWLEDSSSKKDENGYDQQTQDPWHYYENNLSKAKDFHENLADKLHPETYQFYSTDLKTVDRVEIMGQKRLQQGGLYLETRDKNNFIMEIRDEKSDKSMSPGDFAFTSALAGKHCLVYSLNPPAGSGDGTVPDSSGRALKAKASGYKNISSSSTIDINENDEGFYKRKHDDIYNTKTAKHITLKAIENLCKYKIKKETGTA